MINQLSSAGYRANLMKDYTLLLHIWTIERCLPLNVDKAHEQIYIIFLKNVRKCLSLSILVLKLNDWCSDTKMQTEALSAKFWMESVILFYLQSLRCT